MLFKKYFELLVCMYVCMSIYGYVHDFRASPKLESLGTLGLELQAVMSYLIWILGSKLRS